MINFDRSNFLGTKFTIYDSQPPHGAGIQPNSRSSRRFHSRQVSPRVPACNYIVSTIAYELNVLRTRGPRRMNCIMNSIPVSAIHKGENALTLTSLPPVSDETFSPSPTLKGKTQMRDSSSASQSELPGLSEPLTLKSKAPRWDEQCKGWHLDFKGRVTVASVKNFQFVAAVDPSHNVSPEEQEKGNLAVWKDWNRYIHHGLLLSTLRLPSLCHLLGFCLFRALNLYRHIFSSAKSLLSLSGVGSRNQTLSKFIYFTYARKCVIGNWSQEITDNYFLSG